MAAALGSRGARRLLLLLSALKPGLHVPRAGPSAAFSSSVTSARVAVNGIHLHYLRTGEGEHAVLLLPGMLGSGETDFGPQIETLSKKLFTVVAWDPRGYGHSRPPDRDFPVGFFERDAEDAIGLMKTLKFKKVSLLGWSDGGITALTAAARYPSYVSKMVIWGANAYVTDQDERIYQEVTLSRLGRRLRWQLRPCSASSQMPRLRPLGVRVRRNHQDLGSLRHNGKQTWATPPAALAQQGPPLQAAASLS
ncbi:valacyclovir hydrolase isoform X4 [Phacochoerus africanus]|uniref:valacyclovir hydrolase isoform X4 n=1 Tax=Phacochoerus africanus TaxID=41426 RepID=UPI001FDAA884|nr:valacyclovir hydrolase isoform X4 [Phacochoerus africanus]